MTAPFFDGFDDTGVTLPSGLTLRVREAGSGPPVVLLHGYPQTSACWHRVAPRLVAAGYRVILPDLRGYGGSDKPDSLPDHSPYSKRQMAQDIADLMTRLGHETFHLAGHDRGGRVAHRLMLDHSARVLKGAVLDIAPTATMYARTDRDFATGYYHWFFLIQPAPLPETLIAADPAFYLRKKLGAWGKSGMDVFDPRAVAEYIDAFNAPACIAATCEDYRASATLDLAHDADDADARIACPLLVLWGQDGLVGRLYDVLEVWRAKASHVQGLPIAGGHFLPEERPEDTAAALIAFFDAP